MANHQGSKPEVFVLNAVDVSLSKKADLVSRFKSTATDPLYPAALYDKAYQAREGDILLVIMDVGSGVYGAAKAHGPRMITAVYRGLNHLPRRCNFRIGGICIGDSASASSNGLLRMATSGGPWQIDFYSSTSKTAAVGSIIHLVHQTPDANGRFIQKADGTILPDMVVETFKGEGKTNYRDKDVVLTAEDRAGTRDGITANILANIARGDNARASRILDYYMATVAQEIADAIVINPNSDVPKGHMNYYDMMSRRINDSDTIHKRHFIVNSESKKKGTIIVMLSG